MLCPATGILYTNMFHIFLLNSVGQTPELLLTTAFLPCVNAIQENHTTQAFAVLAWAAIYGVKSTFFAFFKPLIVFRRKLKIYFWTCVGFTIIVFALSTSAVFVLGMFERRAFETGMRVERQTFVFTVFVGLGDVGSDVMSTSPQHYIYFLFAKLILPQLYRFPFSYYATRQSPAQPNWLSAPSSPSPSS